MEDPQAEQLGAAVVLLSRAEKRAGDAEISQRLAGKLYASASGWLMLHVPNALGRGAFEALNEPGAELPLSKTNGQYNAHISVMRPEELESIGGIDKITERGRDFHYTLGPVKSVSPSGWDEVSKCWFISVTSSELKTLRKSYGLTPLPNDDEFDFHITFAIRKKSVLRPGEISKAASLFSLARQLDPAGFAPPRPAEKIAAEVRSLFARPSPLVKTAIRRILVQTK